MQKSQLEDSRYRKVAAVGTVLMPAERLRVDAAGEGVYKALHRETLDDIIRDLKQERINAVLVSVARCDAYAMSRVATLVREFPRVTAVALLTHVEAATPQTVLALGQSGVRTLVDVRESTGWRDLRNTLTTIQKDIVDRMFGGQLLLDLAGSPSDCLRLFQLMFSVAPRVTTVRALCGDLHVVPSTLMSRFFRAGLPAPKRYLAMARLVHAAALFENPGLSVANVSDRLDYSSPQSFGRHVRTMLRITAGVFRDRYDGEGMLNRFRTELILPYLGTLRTFRPLTAPPGWIPSEARQ
ncbi:MAG: hypothetical protein NVSMB22_00020 [Chloroflexota bacterium]